MECHGDLAQRNLGTLFERWGGHHQRIAFLDHGVAIGQHRCAPITKHQDHEHVRRAGNVRERASGKRMSSAHLELYKRHAVFVAVVVKGAAHVAGRIDLSSFFATAGSSEPCTHNARHGNPQTPGQKGHVRRGTPATTAKRLKGRPEAAPARPAHLQARPGGEFVLKGARGTPTAIGRLTKGINAAIAPGRQQHLRQACGRDEAGQQKKRWSSQAISVRVLKRCACHLDFAGDVADPAQMPARYTAKSRCRLGIARQRVVTMAHGEQKMVSAPSAVACAFNQAARRPADSKARPTPRIICLANLRGDVDVAAVPQV